MLLLTGGGKKTVTLVKPDVYMVVTHCDERNGLVWTDVLARDPSLPHKELEKINVALSVIGLDVTHLAIRDKIGC